MLGDYFKSIHSSTIFGSYLYLIVSLNGEVWAQEDKDFDMASRKLERNLYIDYIKNINDLQNVSSWREFVYNDKMRNYYFDISIETEMSTYGLTEIYPEYYGIEFRISTRNGFCTCSSLIKLRGSDADSFYNARVLTS